MLLVTNQGSSAYKIYISQFIWYSRGIIPYQNFLEISIANKEATLPSVPSRKVEVLISNVSRSSLDVVTRNRASVAQMTNDMAYLSQSNLIIPPFMSYHYSPFRKPPPTFSEIRVTVFLCSSWLTVACLFIFVFLLITRCIVCPFTHIYAFSIQSCRSCYATPSLSTPILQDFCKI